MPQEALVNSILHCGPEIQNIERKIYEHNLLTSKIKEEMEVLQKQKVQIEQLITEQAEVYGDFVCVCFRVSFRGEKHRHTLQFMDFLMLCVFSIVDKQHQGTHNYCRRFQINMHKNRKTPSCVTARLS